MDGENDTSKDSSTQLLKREFIKLRKQNQRSRIDSIHVLVAIGIVGWYVTTNRESLVEFSNPLDYYFFGSVLLSTVYIILKINLVSIRDAIQTPSIAKVERSISYLFFASLNGLVGVASVDIILSLIGVAQYRLIWLSLAAFLALVLSAAPAVYHYNISIELDSTTQQSDLARYIYENPDVLESGFQPEGLNWSGREQGWLQRADVYGEDKNGNSVIIEIKSYADEDSVDQLKSLVTSTEDIRYIIAAPEFSEDAITELEAHDRLEYCKITFSTQVSVRRLFQSVLNKFDLFTG